MIQPHSKDCVDSSAVHNRFVHSMGVFHLGELTVNQLIKEVQKKIGTPIDLQRIGELFKLACLLHAGNGELPISAIM